MTIIERSYDTSTIESRKVIDRYFELVYTNDVSILDSIFDENAHLYGRSDSGECVLWPIARYRAMLLDRKSPESMDAPRDEELIALDRGGPNQFFAKVRVRIGANVFLDFLTLLKLGKGWKIVSKTYERIA